MRIGIDIGGTFTDLVCSDGRDIHTIKVLSTPGDPSIGAIDAVRTLADRLEIPTGTLLGRTEILIHGTTYATNLLLEEKGARVGLVTTAGFRDLLELREGMKVRRYDMHTPSAPPFVPRYLRLEVPERTRWDGSIETPLDESAVRAALERLRAEEVEALAVCFLHAHRFPVHERRVLEIANEMDWHPFVSLSHEVLAREGEYDRLSTCVINAYVGPGLQRYLERLERRLADAGGRIPVLVAQSSGGVLALAEAARYPVGALTSGPAGGAMAGAYLAALDEIPLLATCDTGGTSTDIAVIRDGAPLVREVLEQDHLKVVASAIDISTLAVGGGSIAWVNPGGLLRLGPESAGADPGPACFGRGGTRATLTDANLVLGYLPANGEGSGLLRLDHAAAHAAIARALSDPLAIDVEDAARSVVALANAMLAEGIRAVTLNRGLDPRDLTLLAFGGGGGLHADALARELGVPRVVVPHHAPVLSALGFLAADVRHNAHFPVGRALHALDGDAIREGFRAVEERGRARLAAEGFAAGDMGVERYASMRYLRQVHSVEVPVGDGDLASPDTSWLAARFEERYAELFYHVHEGEDIVVESLRIASLGRLARLELPREERRGTLPAPVSCGTRRSYLGHTQEVPVYRLESLRGHGPVDGPALVDAPSTTVVVQPRSRCTLDVHGSLVIEVGDPR